MSAGGVSVDFVLESMDPGGAERHTLWLARRLTADGARIRLFVERLGGDLEQGFQNAGVHVSHASTYPGEGKSGTIMHVFSPTMSRWLRYAPAGTCRIYSARTLHRNEVGLYHSNPVRKAAADILFRLRERGLIRDLHFADAILGNSRAVVESLIGIGVRPTKTQILYNGVYLHTQPRRESRRSVLEEFGLDEGRVIVSLVANLKKVKGHDILLQALSGLEQELLSVFAVLLVGTDQGEMAALRKRVASLQLERTVFFTGPRHDVARLLAASDIALNVSHREGFSNAVIEAMATGLPLIVTDVGGNAEAVRHGIDGLVIPPGDAAALLSALQTLADPQRRLEMGEHGKERAVAHFTEEQCWDAYRMLYSKMVSERQESVASGGDR
ncbi:MAG: glycosyltransferase family 4 protein [Parvibaculaceae bacterium]